MTELSKIRPRSRLLYFNLSIALLVNTTVRLVRPFSLSNIGLPTLVTHMKTIIGVTDVFVSSGEQIILSRGEGDEVDFLT